MPLNFLKKYTSRNHGNCNVISESGEGGGEAVPMPAKLLQGLKNRSDIEEIVSSYVSLKRSGKNMVGLCTFHSEKSPSFNVYPDNGTFS